MFVDFLATTMKIGIRTFIVVSLIYRRVTSVGEDCPPSWKLWESDRGHFCYWKSNDTDKRNFSDSLAECRKMDAILASTKTEQEFKFINTTIRNCTASRCSSLWNEMEQYWIGLYIDKPDSKATTEQRRHGWFWIGVDLTNRTALGLSATETDAWHKWYYEEPTGDANCARMTHNGEWADKPCSHTYRYICKKVTPPVQSTTSMRPTGSFDGPSAGSSDATSPGSSSSSIGMYAGIAAGVVVAVAGTAVVAAVCIKKRLKSRAKTTNQRQASTVDDHLYYNEFNVRKERNEETKSDNCNVTYPQTDSGYDAIQMIQEGSGKSLDMDPGRASYAEVGQFGRTIEHNLVYDTGKPKDTTSGDKGGQYDLPIIKEVSAGTETSGRTGGNRKPAPKPKPSFLKRLKKRSIFRNDQGGEETGKSHGGNVKKKSRRSIRDLYAAVDFTKKRNKVQQ